ncbi:MAG: hypothetical protein JWQ97_1556 [Phenylobacterium sp.]|nr:hypothetical protein [Phenylobacterium sp.]
MVLRLVVYDAPLPGFPFLAVVLEGADQPAVLAAEAHATMAEAEAAVIKLAEEINKGASQWNADAPGDAPSVKPKAPRNGPP